MSQNSIDKLISAVQFGDVSCTQESISTNPELARGVDGNGCSLLHWACINNRRAIAEILLANGADLNRCGGKLNEIPIQWAVRNEKYTMLVQYLIERGSNLSHKSVSGMDSLHVACRAGGVNMAFLLLSAGAPVDTIDHSGDSPLHWCIKNNAEIDTSDLQRLLLRMGADCALRDAEGNNVLHLIALTGKGLTDTKFAFSVVQNTIKNKGKKYTDEMFLCRNKEGLTPYLAAIKNKNPDMLRFLLDIFLYRHLPHFLPALATTLSTVAPFFSIKFFGFSWLSLAVMIVSMILLEKLTQPNLVSTKTGLAWGLIFTAEYSYIINVAKHCHPLMNLFVAVIGVTIVVTLHFSISTKANSLTPDGDRQNLINTIAYAGLPEGPVAVLPAPDAPIVEAAHVPRLCSTCLVDKTKATMHCSRCNICVVGLDHHCPFVDNCVGLGNRRVFVFFTLSASFGCMLNAILSIIVQHTVTCPNESGNILFRGGPGMVAVQLCVQRLNPFFSVTPWMALLVSLWIFVLFFHQIWMVTASTTTFQLVRGHHDGSGNSLRVSLSNLKEFFRSGHFNIVRKKRKPCCPSHAGSSHSHDHSHSHGHSHPPLATAGRVIETAASTLSNAVAPLILGKEEASEREMEQERERVTAGGLGEIDEESGDRARLLGSEEGQYRHGHDHHPSPVLNSEASDYGNGRDKVSRGAPAPTLGSYFNSSLWAQKVFGLEGKKDDEDVPRSQGGKHSVSSGMSSSVNSGPHSL